MNIHKCVQRAGLEVKDIILEPIASADAVLSDEEKEAGVVLVDIGGGTTDVAIFHEGIIRHTAVIPFGGNVITEDIKEGCSIMRKQAEKLKVKFGSSLASESQENEIVSISLKSSARCCLISPAFWESEYSELLKNPRCPSPPN